MEAHWKLPHGDFCAMQLVYFFFFLFFSFLLSNTDINSFFSPYSKKKKKVFSVRSFFLFSFFFSPKSIPLIVFPFLKHGVNLREWLKISHPLHNICIVVDLTWLDPITISQHKIMRVYEIFWWNLQCLEFFFTERKREEAQLFKILFAYVKIFFQFFSSTCTNRFNSRKMLERERGNFRETYITLACSCLGIC